MDFLIYSRAIPDNEIPEHSVEDQQALNERHWSYMDGFADRFTARGPTLGSGRDSWTGSMHIVDLLDAEAARAFVMEEPYQQTGLFAEHSVWRFTNLLGRTMWEFPGATDDPKFLLLAESPTRGTPVPVGDLTEMWRDALVVYGTLSTLEGEPFGLAIAVQVSSRDALAAFLVEPSMRLSDSPAVEVHDWEFGGRR
jgi:uncharacterized protein YciI